MKEIEPPRRPALNTCSCGCRMLIHISAPDKPRICAHCDRPCEKANCGYCETQKRSTRNPS